MKRKKNKFIRAGYWEYSKLGLRRNKKLKYRKARGIDNKVRLRMKGHLRNVSIGFRNEKKARGLLQNLSPVLISNVEELKQLKKDEIAIVKKVSLRKKIEIAEYAIKHNIKLKNLNPNKIIEKSKVIIKEKKEKRSKIKERRKERDKRAKDAEMKKTEEEKEKNLEKTVKNEENVNGENKAWTLERKKN